MKFRIFVENEDKDKPPWWEYYDKDDVNDPTQWGKDIIAWFNNTLRRGEKPRRFIKAENLTPNEPDLTKLAVKSEEPSKKS